MKKRNSSLSLLKILCMLSIIFGHYYTHGLFAVDSNLFTVKNFDYTVLFSQFMAMFARLSCSIYVIITGYYFMNSDHFSKNIKKIFYLILEMTFYSVIILISILLFNYTSISGIEIIKLLIPGIFGNWFIVNYIILLLAAPFINKFIKKISNHDYTLFLIIALLIWGGIPTIFCKAWIFSSIDFFIIMYLVGGYIRKYENQIQHVSNKVFYILIISSIILLLLSVVLLDLIGLVLKNNNFIMKATHFNDYNNILTITIAISTFILFNRKVYSCKIFDIISSTTLGIYLLHDNFYLKQWIWNGIFPNISYLNTNWFFIHAILKVISIFIICSIIDLLRLTLLEYRLKKVLDNSLNKYYEKIKKFLYCKLNWL